MINYRFLPIGLASILLSITLLISCKDEDPDKDNQNPLITILSPTSSDHVKGTVSVNVEVDEPNLKNVQVYIDATLLGESTTNVFELTWDSKTVPDGIHVIKVVATDNENNQGESTLQVDVLNTLLTFSIPANYMNENLEIWFFITNNNGDLLGVKQAQNGTDLNFETPDSYKKEETFILNVFSVTSFNQEGGFYDMHVSSFTELKPGKYGYKSTNASSRTIIGSQTVTIDNVPLNEGLFPAVYGADVLGASSSGSNGQWVCKTDLYENNTTVLYSFRKSVDANYAPRFKLFTNVNAGDEALVDFSNFAEMNTTQLPVYEDYSHYNSSVRAYPNAGDYTKSFILYNLGAFVETVQEINLYHISGIGEYNTYVSLDNDNERRTYTKIGSLPTSVKKVSVAINESSWNGTDLNLSISGSCDFLGAYFSSSLTQNDIFYAMAWYVYMPGASGKVKIPQLPSEITSKYSALSLFPNRDFNKLYMAEYEGFSDYNDYLKFLYQSNDIMAARNKETMTLQVEMGNSGGRKSKLEWQDIPALE